MEGWCWRAPSCLPDWMMPLPGERPWWAPIGTSYCSPGIPALVRGRPGYRFQKWAMNSAGFRGPDIALTAPPGRERIAILGASETFGLFESEGHEFPAQLQVVLDSLEPRRFAVVNAAPPGMGLPSMASYYTRVSRHFDPGCSRLPFPVVLPGARASSGRHRLWPPRRSRRSDETLEAESSAPGC